MLTLELEDYMKLETQCLHEGYSPKNGEPRVVPIVQSTTYRFDSTEQRIAKSMEQKGVNQRSLSDSPCSRLILVTLILIYSRRFEIQRKN